MKVNKKKESYKAPEMKATSFKAEQGYATSSVTSTSLKINMGGSTL